MATRFFFIIMFFCSHNFYACSEFKSSEESTESLECIDLTPERDLDVFFQSALSYEPYSGISPWRSMLRADQIGSCFVYNEIDKNSSLYKERERLVEEFVATNPDSSLKAKYYSGVLCDGMAPARYEYFLPGYCHVHHCYEHKCLSLYGLQAFLLQPKGIKIEEDSVDEVVQEVGRKEVLRRVASQYTMSKNAVRGLLQRSLGVKPGMKSPAKPQLELR